MKFVIQRVQSASVTVDEKIVGKIGNGYLVLIGIAQTDTKDEFGHPRRKRKSFIGFPVYAVCRL